MLSGFADISQGIFLVLFVVFVARRLHGGAGGDGLLRGVQALGAIGAGLTLAVVARAGAPARLMGGAALAFGVISLLIWNLPCGEHRAVAVRRPVRRRRRPRGRDDGRHGQLSAAVR